MSNVSFATQFFCVDHCNLSLIAKYFASLTWLFPNSYTEIYEKIGFGNALTLMLLVFITYSIVLKVIGNFFFKKLEY